MRPTRLHWIQDHLDDPKDLCAHSPVDFRIDDEVLVPPEGDWSVNAAAFHLLRTVSLSHSAVKDGPLFQCCAHSMFVVDGEVSMPPGLCPNVELEIVHDDGDVLVGGRRVFFRSWAAAVCGFSDAVADFYSTSAPKQPWPDDTEAFDLFMREWERRRKHGETLL